MPTKNELKNRDLYLNKLISFCDMEPIKVITGIRRCGKSSMLKLMIEYLKKKGISKECICFLMKYREFISGKMP